MAEKQEMEKYQDIINLPYPTSKTRTRMSLSDRAAQFLPFAALTGHEDAIAETARLTDKPMELDDNTKAILNEKLQILQDYGALDPQVIITYFQPDEKKSGGSFRTVSGCLKKIDQYSYRVIMADETEIFMEHISEIESDLFNHLELY